MGDLMFLTRCSTSLRLGKKACLVCADRIWEGIGVLIGAALPPKECEPY